MSQMPPPPAGPPSEPKPSESSSGSSGSSYPASYHPAYPSGPQSFPPAAPYAGHPAPPPTQPQMQPPPPPGPPPGWSPGPPPPPRKGRGLVLALVVAAVLVVGGGGAGIAVWANRGDDGTTTAGDRNDPAPVTTEDPTIEPTDDPSTATVEPAPEPTTVDPAPTTPTDAPTDEPSYGGGLTDPVEPPETDPPDPQLSKRPFSYEEYGRDWKFSLDGVKLNAQFVSGVDHADCGPVENGGALTDLGCRKASEWTQRSLGGKLVLTHVVMTMKSPAAAERATATDKMRITQDSWTLRPVGYLADSPGVWKAVSVGQFVVLTVVTYDDSVPDKKGEKYLTYANGDIRGALLFRF